MTAMFIGLCAAVFFYDLLFRRVPNQLILVGLATGTIDLLWTGNGIGGIDTSQAILGGLIGLALFVPLYAMKAMGAGDVKYYALLGFLLGTHYLLPLWLISSVLAGIHAIGVYLGRLNIVAMPAIRAFATRIEASNAYQRMLEKRQGRKGIPYAAYLSIAAVGVCVYHV